MYRDEFPIRILRIVALNQGIERERRRAKLFHKEKESSFMDSSQRKSSINIQEYHSSKYPGRNNMDDCHKEDVKKEGVCRRLHEYFACREEEARRWAEGIGSLKSLPSFSSFNNSNHTIHKKKSKNKKYNSFNSFNTARNVHNEIVTPLNEAKVIMEKPHSASLPWPNNNHFLKCNKGKGYSGASSTEEKEKYKKELLLLEKGNIQLRMMGTGNKSNEAMEFSSLSFEELSKHLSSRHLSRYRRLHHVLNHSNCSQLRNLWERSLPVFAMSDTAPQVMDLDLQQSSSRVARCTEDKGVVVI
ncbi:unnamed protein product [Phytomonas sp. Hart1]|nr:unnamed protein product [Phytomonas sp. Hart1]|eukprot:CCW68352.1 unnamed protein product [Phytomonas sp. isolate Hart1]